LLWDDRREAINPLEKRLRGRDCRVSADFCPLGEGFEAAYMSHYRHTEAQEGDGALAADGSHVPG